MKPQDLDMAVCEWTKDTGYSLGKHQLDSLVASIFNALFSDGNIHSVPDDNTHCESKDCWCSPNLEYKNETTGMGQWLHTGTRKEALQ